MKRRFLCLVLALLILCAVSGCAEEVEAKTLTIRMTSILGDSDSNAVYSGVLREFSTDNSIYIKDTTSVRSDAYKLGCVMEETYTGTEAPDIVYYYSSELSGEKLRQYFVPLSEIKKDYPDFASGISEKALESVRADDGEIYCIPVSGSFLGIAVNKAIFETNGLAVPTNRAELASAAKTLSQRGIILFANPADDCADILEQILLALGGEESVEKALDGVSGSDALWQQTLTIYDELYAAGAFPPAAISGDFEKYVSPTDLHDAILGADRDKHTHVDPFELFGSSKAAMIAIDADEVSSIASGENIDLIMLPLDRTDWMTASFIEGFFITRTAYNSTLKRDLVVDIVSRMITPESCAGFAQAAGGASAAKDTSMLENKLCANASQRIFESEHLYKTTQSGARTARWNEITKIVAAHSLGAVDVPQSVRLIGDRTISIDSLISEATAQNAVVSSSDAAQSAALPAA